MNKKTIYNRTMNKLKFTFVMLLLSMFATQVSFGQDWANLNRFKAENANQVLPTPGERRVVFMGNSITEGWINIHPEFFAGKFYINRGIGGQTTPQMLVRFRADVIKLKPRVVVILAGTNDIAGNSGPSTLEMIEDNIISMAQLAKANDIKVILCSVLPVYDYPWKTGLKPAEKIIELNKLIKNYASKSDIIYLDFFSAMVDERNGLKAAYSKDGVHPNEAGYNVMEPLTEKAIDKAFNINKPETTAKKTVAHKKTVTHKKTAVKKAPVVQKKPVVQKAPVQKAPATQTKPVSPK
ncbi:MAG TPA: SGNH/GDSL hydrolase family protein [Prolixibacteraceae bacterium]|nr:SGNH/GDSL hydrolase family protein [Prolixibacteraceae bacterium]